MIKSILACHDHLIISANGRADEYSSGIIANRLIYEDKLYLPFQTADHFLMQKIVEYRDSVASEIYSFASYPPNRQRRLMGIYLTSRSNAINTVQTILNSEDNYLIKDQALIRQLSTESIWLDKNYKIFTHYDLNKGNWSILSNMEENITRERYFEWMETVGREWFPLMHYYLDLKELRKYLTIPENERDDNVLKQMFKPYMPVPQLFFDLDIKENLTHYATVATLLDKKEPLLISRKVRKQFIDQPNVKFKPKLKITNLPYFINF